MNVKCDMANNMNSDKLYEEYYTYDKDDKIWRLILTISVSENLY
jgi:hypothetical protein